MTSGLDSEPLLPYVVGLLVAAVTLAIVGVVVIVLNGRRPAGARRRDTAAWWTCTACGAGNAPERRDCYACHAARPAPRANGGEHPDEPDAGATVTTPDPPPER